MLKDAATLSLLLSNLFFDVFKYLNTDRHRRSMFCDVNQPMPYHPAAVNFAALTLIS